MPVVREVGGSKYHHSVEYWQDFGFAVGHGAIPQLQMAAIFLPPFLVQIQNYIQASIQIVFRMFVEIGMNTKLTSRQDLMKPASVKAGIRESDLECLSRHSETPGRLWSSDDKRAAA